MSALLKYFSIIVSLSSLLLAALLATLSYWPDSPLSVALGYLLLFSPRWWVLLLCLLPLLTLKQLRLWQYLSWGLSAVVFVQFQDIQTHWSASQQGELRVLSLNSGGGSNAAAIRKLVTQQQPDIVFMQESNAALLETIFDETWHQHCDSLCTASRTPLTHLGSLSRTPFGGWGNFAVFYQTTINDKVIHLANIHLETPRSTIASLLHRRLDKSALTELQFTRNMEASLIASWAKQQQTFIMAGDFNMTIQENLYHRHLAQFNNAIDLVGSGINYSKYTAWHGTRIDHVLASSDLLFQSAKAVAAVGGDHRPLIASFNLKR